MIREKCIWVCFALLSAAAGRVDAHDTDWIYFPMYERDTAHAVHLSALHFRDDGLLESATRYPRNPSESWTEEESKQGWYDYSLRLIDCETGFHIDTADRLLTRDGATVAERTRDAKEWRAQLEEQLRNPSNLHWPDDSEIVLACVAASHPTLKARRAQAARKSAAVVANRPLVQGLIAETATLSARAQRFVNIAELANKRPRSAGAVFEAVVAQYDNWRRALNLKHLPPVADAAALAALQSRIDARLVAGGSSAGAVRALAPGRVESTEDWETIYDAPPRQAPEAVRTGITQRCDCRNGIQVPISKGWYAADGRLLWTQPIPVSEVLEQLRRNYPDDVTPEPPNLLQPRLPAMGSSIACALLADAMHEAAGEAAPAGLENFKLESLAGFPTPAAMLLAIRAVL